MLPRANSSCQTLHRNEARIMSTLKYRPFHRRHLPHVQPPGAVLFVTFRLAGSIPREVRARLVAEAERSEALLSGIADPMERDRQAYLDERRLFGHWDRALDMAKSGPLWLGDPKIAHAIAEALHYRDGRVYELEAFCIMPNHVHAVFAPLPGDDGTYHALSAIMHSLKRYTARQANQLLGRRGTFWQGESYDHVVRDEREHERIIRYVVDNPVKAGLVKRAGEWEWSYCKYDL
jgi:putative transposase